MANERRAGRASAEEERTGQAGADEDRAAQVGVGEGRASEVGAAVPAAAAGGASGLFSSAQQLGGAAGVAPLGTVFFGWVTSGHTFAAATTHTGPYAVGAFMVCALLSLLLPRTAVSDAALIGSDDASHERESIAGRLANSAADCPRRAGHAHTKGTTWPDTYVPSADSVALRLSSVAGSPGRWRNGALDGIGG